MYTAARVEDDKCVLIWLEAGLCCQDLLLNVLISQGAPPSCLLLEVMVCGLTYCHSLDLSQKKKQARREIETPERRYSNTHAWELRGTPKNDAPTGKHAFPTTAKDGHRAGIAGKLTTPRTQEPAQRQT